MATTKIWTIKGNMNVAIPKVIDYVKNPEKTTTEKGVMTSALNCDIQTAARDFIMTKYQYGKTDKILAWHGYQSFKGHEVSPELAHQIGVMMAQELWGDRFQVVVGTHVDGNNIHNHFVVNSVSFADGKKFYGSEETYAEMRAVSDRLCKDFNLSYIKNPGKGNTRQYGEWNAEQKGLPTKRSLIRRDIDSVIGTSFSWRDFLSQMEKLGYTVNTRGKYAKLKPLGSDKFFRFDKMGNGYTVEEIQDRIRYGCGTYVPQPNRKVRYQGTLPKKKKATGFKALYFYYCYKMGVFQKRSPNHYTTAAILDDVKQIENIMEDYHFLNNTGISTKEQLLEYQNRTEQKYKSLLQEKTQLQKQIKQSPDDEHLKNQMSAVKQDMKYTVHELKLCMRIKERSQKMSENLKEFRKEKNHERRSRCRSASSPDNT